MNMVAFCYKGKANMDINGTLTELEENQLLVCPPKTHVRSHVPHVALNCLIINTHFPGGGRT